MEAREKYEGYSEWIKQKQERRDLPNEMIERVIEEVMGERVIFKERIVEGEINIVYRVTTGSGRVIVRGNLSQYIDLAKESWVSEQFEAQGVPVAKVWGFVDKIKIGEQIWSCGVMEELPGWPLVRELKFGARGNTGQKMEEIGSVLGRMHQVAAPGWGEIVSEGEVTGEDWWTGIVRKKENNLIKNRAVLSKFGFNPDWADLVFEVLCSKEKLIKGCKPVLSHGDFSVKNVLVDENRVTGVIDFGLARGTDPSFDFGWWDRSFGDWLPAAWLVEGYRQVRDWDEGMWEKAMLHRLLFGLELVGHYGGWRYEVGMKAAAEEVERGLRYFGVVK